MSDLHYQDTAGLLQVTFTPETYRILLTKYRRGQAATRFSKSLAGSDYWDRLPIYLLARCPFCAAAYTAKIDTHSLFGWVPHPEKYKGVYDEEHQQIDCAHFVGVQTFVNLRNQVPRELAYYSSHLDVPFVTPTLLPLDASSIAVMHGLPICRLEHEQFVPRYVAYTISYFTLQPLELRARRRAENQVTIARDHSFYPTLLYTNAEAAVQPETFDLQHWVRQDKLYWLDLTAPDLPLKANPVETFPYTGIQGYARHYAYRDGIIELY